MKKIGVIVASVVLLGVVTSWAQTTVVASLDITLSGSLSDKTKVTEADLIPGTGVLTGKLVFAELQVAGTNETNNVLVIGSQALSGVTTNIGGGSNAVILATTQAIILEEVSSADLGKGKFESAFVDAGNNPSISGAVWIVTGTIKEDSKGTNVTAKAVGIWEDGTAIKSLSIKSAKTK